MPGRHLYQLACRVCSARAREHIVVPAIADFQHQYAAAAGTGARLHALVRGYLTVWQTLGWCLLRDAFTPDVYAFHRTTAAAFLVAVVATAGGEYLLFHTSATVRRLGMQHLPYLYWSALSASPTLEFGVPLAMLPAVLYARSQIRRRPRAATEWIVCAAATLLTLVSTGWMAPMVGRQRIIAGHDAFVLRTGGRFYIDPLDWQLDRASWSKSWPSLIRGALRREPIHRYPEFPWNVASVDERLPHADREEILSRLILVALGVLASILGWLVGADNAVTTSPVAWWIAAWIVTIGGEPIGRLAPIVAFLAVLLLIVARRHSTAAA
jgi:hypothetical protein